MTGYIRLFVTYFIFFYLKSKEIIKSYEYENKNKKKLILDHWIVNMCVVIERTIYLYLHQLKLKTKEKKKEKHIFIMNE